MPEAPSTGFEIDPEFINENSRIHLVRPRKKFAPYTKAERLKRRKEVYHLHFELGHPALRIAGMMNVDKNTINNDIQLLYQELGKESDRIDFTGYYAKQVARLESQRGRLIEYLEKENDIERKLAIERLVADIDFKMLNTATKLEYSATAFWDAVYKKINEIAGEKKLDYRATTIFEAIKISIKARRKLDNLLKEVSH